MNEARLQQSLERAILESMTTEDRDRIIREAIIHLTSAHPGGYSSERKSKIDEAFKRAVERVANEQAYELVKNDERVIELMRTMMAGAVERLLVNQEEIKEALAKNLVRHINDVIHDRE